MPRGCRRPVHRSEAPPRMPRGCGRPVRRSEAAPRMPQLPWRLVHGAKGLPGRSSGRRRRPRAQCRPPLARFPARPRCSAGCIAIRAGRT
eukprot:scaffold40173_cov60-Phaeocystis_antarctica.AAC.2